jgi:4-methylaminobutanoate oxidase (formaldehyde-forming)
VSEEVRVAIIGGGIIGSSIAYHLAKLGWKDVLVIEKGELTSGSTWHAAGLVGQLRSSRNVTRMLQHSAALYARLEAETGQATGWRQVGSLRLASSQERMQELKRSATTARSFGLHLELLGPKEAQDLFPPMTLDGVVGAAFLPTDGYADPAGVALALARGARQGGARFRTRTRVTGFEVDGRRVRKVLTDQGEIAAEFVVNAAGMWARELGRKAGVDVPLIPVMHQYLVTEPIPGLPTGLPTMRDPDNLIYYKEEVGALVMGGYEPNPIPWHTEGPPRAFGQELLAPDFEHFEQISLRAMERTPALKSVGVKKLINGPEAFTPDGHFIMGRAPGLENFFVAAGFNAHGIAAGGGAGKMMAEWIAEGRPSLDLWPVDVRRFGKHHQSIRYVAERTVESYARHYSIAWPHEEAAAGRPLKRSPLYYLLLERGACYGEKFGWERPNYFVPEGDPPANVPTFGWPSWFDQVGREHRATRSAVALFDQTSFSKFEVRGRRALEALQRIAANDLERPIGSLVYTQLLNERGGIECDLTFARLGADRFYVVTGTAFATHDFDWIERHLPEDGSASIADVTSSRAVINVCGPRSRELLERLSSEDFSNAAFPFAQAREVSLASAPVLALRVTYVGELGWELHVPVEYACHLYERLRDAGSDLGVIDAGYKAIESLRLEKGYRYWSTDLTPDYNPYEAGLGFCVALDKGEFIGREALLRAKREGLKRKLCCFILDEASPMAGGETIAQGDLVLGVASSGGYGYTVEKTIAYGYIPIDKSKDARFEIEVLGRRIGATRQDRAPYDPERTRILM